MRVAIFPVVGTQNTELQKATAENILAAICPQAVCFPWPDVVAQANPGKAAITTAIRPLRLRANPARTGYNW
jgi:hypothetical protein